MNTRTRRTIAFALIILGALLLASCGSDTKKVDGGVGKDGQPIGTPPKLLQVRGKVHLGTTQGNQLGIQPHSGAVVLLSTTDDVDSKAELRSLAMSQEPVVAYYREERGKKVFVRIERQKAPPASTPRVTGEITKVGDDGSLEIRTEDNKTYAFITEKPQLELFDAEHLREHKKSGQPVVVYYSKPAQPGTTTGLVFLGYEDAGPGTAAIPAG